ncbi:MAG: hydroxymethylbilane synthase, partial [Rhodobacteraceae bacterium]|nr:hydroxymethylbilane synthase [Paracoccaceae bacterium]
MNKIKSQIRIGSRGSRLALLQAGEVKKLLLENLDWEEDRIEVFTIKTLGDKITDRPFR